MSLMREMGWSESSSNLDFGLEPILTFDHSSLFLATGRIKGYRKTGFKLKNMWLEHPAARNQIVSQARNY